MKKIVLTVAVVLATLLGFSSCKNAKMVCWEYTITYGGNTESGYMWVTQDQMEYEAYIVKKRDAIVSYKKSKSYKTADDCVGAMYALDERR
ncbi:MAG: hypothetical protein MJZ93_06510 [Paludibacteraceae bacterium]|nr:hypothetical protein [Paludibacteraceae bacterium]